MGLQNMHRYGDCFIIWFISEFRTHTVHHTDHTHTVPIQTTHCTPYRPHTLYTIQTTHTVHHTDHTQCTPYRPHTQCTPYRPHTLYVLPTYTPSSLQSPLSEHIDIYINILIDSINFKQEISHQLKLVCLGHS